METSSLGTMHVMCCMHTCGHTFHLPLSLFSRYGQDFKRLIICPVTEGPEAGHCSTPGLNPSGGPLIIPGRPTFVRNLRPKTVPVTQSKERSTATFHGSKTARGSNSDRTTRSSIATPAPKSNKPIYPPISEMIVFVTKRGTTKASPRTKHNSIHATTIANSQHDGNMYHTGTRLGAATSTPPPLRTGLLMKPDVSRLGSSCPEDYHRA